MTIAREVVSENYDGNREDVIYAVGGDYRLFLLRACESAKKFKVA